MKRRKFIQCDVFSSQPTKGNGLAVVVDGEELAEDQMQAFAAWTNLAETTFLLPPTDPRADYRVKIYTPGREMLFAGHPTLGSCATWLHCGGIPSQDGLVRQECGIGIVDIDLSGPVPAFVAPSTTIEPLAAKSLNAICAALELETSAVVRSAKLNNGPVWQALELGSADAVLAVDSSKVRWPDFQSIGLIGAHSEGSECDFEVRMLAPSSGMSEDPITGSLNAALACWLSDQGRLERDLVMAQGTNLGRVGRVYIRRTGDPGEDGSILIGGETQILIEGTVLL